MSRTQRSPSTEIQVPRELDAGDAPEVYATLLERLSQDEPDGKPLRIDLSGHGDVWPLALQLLASAQRSVPKDQIVFGPAASAALETLATPKEETR